MNDSVLSNATCFQNNGSITISATGGTPVFSFNWSNGATTSTVTGLYGDSLYAVTITDSHFCSADTSFTLLNTGAPAINLINKTDVSCFGFSDGAIDIDVSGGVPPYTYLWQGILATTQDISGQPAGNYNVSVTDSSGCSNQASYVLSQQSQIVISFPSTINSNCGQANGSINASSSGGTPPYSYLWSTGDTTDSVSGLLAGSYTITVTDFAGCSKSSIENISDIGGPVITQVDSTLITCPAAITDQ